MGQCSESKPGVGWVRPRGPHRQQQPSLHASPPSNGFNIHILHSQEPSTAVAAFFALSCPATVVAVCCCSAASAGCGCRASAQPETKESVLSSTRLLRARVTVSRQQISGGNKTITIRYKQQLNKTSNRVYQRSTEFICFIFHSLHILHCPSPDN